MKIYLELLLVTLFCSITNVALAGDRLELNTTTIKGNKEFPQIMYIVPWKDTEKNTSKTEDQNLVLHSLFGDIFNPVRPSYTAKNNAVNP